MTPFKHGSIYDAKISSDGSEYLISDIEEYKLIKAKKSTLSARDRIDVVRRIEKALGPNPDNHPSLLG